MTTSTQAGFRRACVLMAVLAGLGHAPLAQAATGYAWISTGPNAADFWTNSANWNPSSGTPGAASGDTAALTSGVNNAYTSVLNKSPANALASLALSNGLGTATLVVTQSTGAVQLTVTNKLTLAAGGRLEIGAGGVVSNANTFTWLGTSGQVVLGAGGTFITAGSVTISNSAAGFAGQVAAPGASGPGGVWDLRGQTLTIRGGGSAVNTLTASGVTLSNLTLIVGTSAGINQNALTVSNGAQVLAGANTAYVGQSGASSNTVTIAGANSLLNLSAKGFNVGDTASFGNMLIVTNGGQVLVGAGCNIGNSGTTNTIILSGTGSGLNMGGCNLSVGNNAAWGNVLRIEAGGLVTNANQVNVGFTGGGFNSLIVTNGGQFWKMTNNDFYIGYQSASNAAWIGGNGAQVSCAARNFYCGNAATGNVVVVDDGGSLNACSTVYVGRNSGAIGSVGNTLIITNGGQVLLSSTVHVAYQGSNAFNNVLLVVNGGLLEAQKFYVNNSAVGSVGGNSISNSAGIYQFTNAAPSISLTSNGMVYLASGTISFRAITNADVFCNQAGKALDSASLMSWSGTNAFRLNNATNTAAAGQSYVFDAGRGATNYARLELVNGGTRYRGQAGNTLTIGASGQMLCSNTAAAVDLVFTNSGMLTLVNSTLAFATNAVLSGTLALDLNNLATNNGVVAAARNLALGPASVLTLTGAGTNATLITYAGTLSGAFGTVTLPPGCKLSYGTGSNSAIALKLTPSGSVLLLR